jgi:hypothetical protein
MDVTWTALSVIIGVLSLFCTLTLGIVGWLWRTMSAYQKELSDFKVEVANRYVTADALIQVEGRLAVAISNLGNEVKGSLGEVTRRFDAFLTQMLAATKQD